MLQSGNMEFYIYYLNVSKWDLFYSQVKIIFLFRQFLFSKLIAILCLFPSLGTSSFDFMVASQPQNFLPA